MKNAQGISIKIADEQNYHIQLKRAVPYKMRILSPMAKNIVKGSVLKTLPEDAIADVKPI